MDYIIDFKPYIEENIDNDYYKDIEKRITAHESITQNEAEDFLRVINYIVRNNINPNLDNFDYKCDLAQSILCHYFKKINCQVTACATQNVITAGVEGHSFTIITLNVENEEKNFLLDPTYIQFFKKEKCQESNYFVSPLVPNRILLTPNPGYFINEADKEAAEFLLRYGYIELTPEYAQMYGDSFYNTKPGDDFDKLEFKTIPGNVYINSFLKGKEPLSKTEEELRISCQDIVPFQDRHKGSAKVT